MKKVIFILIILAATTWLPAQETFTIANRTFKVGDTITMTQGANANGNFISGTMAIGGGMAGVEKLPANYAGYRFIIKKLKWYKQGKLNEMLDCVCKINGTTTLHLDLGLAIKKKEIE